MYDALYGDRGWAECTRSMHQMRIFTLPRNDTRLGRQLVCASTGIELSLIAASDGNTTNADGPVVGTGKRRRRRRVGWEEARGGPWQGVAARGRREAVGDEGRRLRRERTAENTTGDGANCHCSRSYSLPDRTRARSNISGRRQQGNTIILRITFPVNPFTR